MSVFHEGDLYKETNEENRKFRILDSNEYSTYLFYLNNNDSGTPKKYSTLLLENFLESKLIEPIVEEGIELISDDELSKKQRIKRDERFETINTLWNDPQDRRRFLEVRLRKELYAEVAEKLDISDRAARTIISNFFKGGMTRNSLIPKYKERGGTGTERSRFRQLTNEEDSSRIEITEKEKSQFRDVYEKAILGKGKTFKEAYQYLLKKYYTRTIQEGENLKTVYTGEPPTEDQFYYWIRKHRRKDAEIIARYGINEYNNHYKPDTGSLRESIDGPGQLYELDATHCNITVVSKFDRNLIIGRPLLYTAIDIYSGMITGFYLGIENESWRTTTLLLINMIEDKVDFCRKYGIEIEERDWPSKNLPVLIKGDKGALDNPKVQQINNAYKTEFTFTPPYSPRLKPFIEHRHKAFKEYFEKHLGKYGADQWNSGERGAHDAREDACLNLDELTRIVIRLILNFNATINSNYPQTPEMIVRNSGTSPIELWEWGIKEGLGSFKVIPDKEEFRLNLLSRVQRKFRVEGIRLNAHKYILCNKQDLGLFFNSLNSEIKVAYNKEDITEAYIYREGKYYPLKMKDYSESYRGMSINEDRKIRQKDLINTRRKQKSQILSNIDLDNYVDEVVKGKDNAITLTRSQKRKRTKDIKKNKNNYIHEVRAEESFKNEEANYPGREVSDKPVEKSKGPTGFDQRRRAFIEKQLKKLKQEEND